ncbi:MAG: RIP metalloprotease, partial [Actinobacteria bacterium]|nr:RIP metalloprotease [Actinomycetota bacterium]
AKATGMKATEFFFGFGPKLWSTQRGETEYGFKALPLGGYVRIVGMNPLEEVAPEDLGRTYREKKFWEKSVVVLAGVGMNFLIGLLLFYGVVLANGMPGEPTSTIATIIDNSPAAEAGIRQGDTITAIGGATVADWEDIPAALERIGPEETTVTIRRGGETLTLSVDLEESGTVAGSGFLGIGPTASIEPVGPFEGVGIAGRLVWDGIGDTFQTLYQMFRPSSLAEYFGVFAGDTDVPDEIRPVSPIGIATIGSQARSVSFFLGILAYVNVILATINLLPLFPLDGGHFSVALYEKITGRQADVRRLLPIAAAVIGIFAFLGFVAIILDVANPINL